MIVIGDADALIALFLEKDSHYLEAANISKLLREKGDSIIFPNTAIVEAITTFQRKFSFPKIADTIKNLYLQGAIDIEYVNQEEMKLAAEFFNPHGYKQNTFFDALVAATAKKLNADAIFSFDTWYKKLGFKLGGDLE